MHVTLYLSSQYLYKLQSETLLKTIPALNLRFELVNSDRFHATLQQILPPLLVGDLESTWYDY